MRKLTTAQMAVMIAIATLGSNILGFVREMLLANYFGAGMVTDAYVMGISIPNTLLAAVISAVGTAYMPILASKFENQGVKEANKYTSELLNLVFVIIAVIFAVCILISSPLISVFAPGFEGEKKALTIYYMRFAFITLFFTVGLRFFDSYLRYKGVFVAQKLIALVQNVFSIAFVFIAAKIDFHLLVFGIIIGMGLDFAGEFLLAKKAGYKYSPSFEISHSVKEVMVLSLPVFIGGSFSEINTFVDKILASNLVEGSVTALNYSGKLITLILTFTVGIFTSMIYPKLNQAFAKEDYGRISELAERGINLLSLVSIPFALGAMVYAKDITKIVYERGAFAEAATSLVAIAFLFYAIRIPFYSISQLVNNAFYAMHETKITVVCSAISMLTNIGLNLILVKVWGLAGLAIATSFAEFVGMITRYIIFERKYKEIKLLRSKRKLLLIIIFSVASVAISYGIYMVCSFASMLIVRLALAVLAAIVSYLAMLYIAKFDELSLIKDLFKWTRKI